MHYKHPIWQIVLWYRQRKGIKIGTRYFVHSFCSILHLPFTLVPACKASRELQHLRLKLSTYHSQQFYITTNNLFWFFLVKNLELKTFCSFCVKLMFSISRLSPNCHLFFCLIVHKCPIVRRHNYSFGQNREI